MARNVSGTGETSTRSSISSTSSPSRSSVGKKASSTASHREYRRKSAPSVRIRPFPWRRRSLTGSNASPGRSWKETTTRSASRNAICSGSSGYRISRSTTRRWSPYHSTLGRCGTFSTSSSAREWIRKRSPIARITEGSDRPETSSHSTPPSGGAREGISEGATVRSSHRFASYRNDVIRTGASPASACAASVPGCVPGGWYRFLRFLVIGRLPVPGGL